MFKVKHSIYKEGVAIVESCDRYLSVSLELYVTTQNDKTLI